MIFTTFFSADTVLQISENPRSYVISWLVQYPKKEYFWTLSYKKLWRIFMFIYIAVSSFLPCFLVFDLFVKDTLEKVENLIDFFSTEGSKRPHLFKSTKILYWTQAGQWMLVQGFKFPFANLYGVPGSHLSSLLRSFQMAA